MLKSIRDVAAVLFLENKLGLLREEFLNLIVAGNSPDMEDWASREDAVMENFKHEFYNAKLRQLIETDHNKDIDDDEDFNNRSQKFMEFAVFKNHKRLQEIPCVGHPDFSED